MFCVVETFEEGSTFCMAVPRKWVNKNGVLFYPAKHIELINMRKKFADPQVNWEQINCKILKDGIGN